MGTSLDGSFLVRKVGVGGGATAAEEVARRLSGKPGVRMFPRVFAMLIRGNGVKPKGVTGVREIVHAIAACVCPT